MKTIACDHCGDVIPEGKLKKPYLEIGVNDNNLWKNFGKQVMTFKIEFSRCDEAAPDLCEECFKRDAKENFEIAINRPKAAVTNADEDIPF